MCLCVCTSVFVRVKAPTCAFALARGCHLVGTDLGLFLSVSFVVVCKTRVKVNSALAFKSPNRMPSAAAQGWKRSETVMHVTSALKQKVRSP